MRSLYLSLACIAALTVSSAQEPSSARCYRFNGPFFWQLYWNEGLRQWVRDTTSIVQLTSLAHPSPPGAQPSEERQLVAYLPRRDSVMHIGSSFTSWKVSATNQITLTWIRFPMVLGFSLRAQADTLFGQMQNHADRVEGPLPPSAVRAVRIPCPPFPPPDINFEVQQK